MTLPQKRFNLYGDNIVECARALGFVVAALGDSMVRAVGPTDSITCPVHSIVLTDQVLDFQFLPGFGDARWNQDIRQFVKLSGGRLREAADAVITLITNGSEVPLVAIEFCGALPAGNQAWQRQGRAYSFAHAGIPYFFVTEIGGFELDSNRRKRSTRIPNPAVPFSNITLTKSVGSPCLPVYQANPGTSQEILAVYSTIFGEDEFLEFLRLCVLGYPTEYVTNRLESKCLQAVELLASSRRKNDSLTVEQWQLAYEAISEGDTITRFLENRARLAWRKNVRITSLTDTARRFMRLCETESFGLTSSNLPLSFVPRTRRARFGVLVYNLYPDMAEDFVSFLASEDVDLSIAWINGFKPKGDDARPDRGLAPFARMLVGERTELMTFVFGPAPPAHWEMLAESPADLAASNGLWESILSVSDCVLIDSSTVRVGLPRGYLNRGRERTGVRSANALRVEAKVLKLGEQDVDTALHVALHSASDDCVFEGMCNPPGGDWSGLSFVWEPQGQEYRWLTLPRVTADGAKRPDHVFALLGHEMGTFCLSVESKERARSLERNVGPRLSHYAQSLMSAAPSVFRIHATDGWRVHEATWRRPSVTFVSAGAYLAVTDPPFGRTRDDTALDIQIGSTVFPDRTPMHHSPPRRHRDRTYGRRILGGSPLRSRPCHDGSP